MEGKNVILHIFMYNVISDFSAATPASEGRIKLPAGVSTADVSFMGTTGIHEFPFYY